MFYVEIDKSQNMLRVTFELRLDFNEAEQCFETVTKLLPELQPNFTILTDLRMVHKIDYEAIPAIEEIMDVCNEKGVSKVIRVILDQGTDVGLNIMSVFHYSHGVKIHTFRTMVEALTHLYDNSTDNQ